MTRSVDLETCEQKSRPVYTEVFTNATTRGRLRGAQWPFWYVTHKALRGLYSPHCHFISLHLIFHHFPLPPALALEASRSSPGCFSGTFQTCSHLRIFARALLPVTALSPNKYTAPLFPYGLIKMCPLSEGFHDYPVQTFVRPWAFCSLLPTSYLSS